MTATHSSLLALINEQQQIRVPCHQTNRIKTKQVLTSLCWLRHVAKWSIKRHRKWFFSAAAFSEVIACFENNRAFQPVGTSFYLLICPFTVERIHHAVINISSHHTGLHKWHTYYMHSLDIFRNRWPRQLIDNEVNGKGYLFSKRDIKSGWCHTLHCL